MSLLLLFRSSGGTPVTPVQGDEVTTTEAIFARLVTADETAFARKSTTEIGIVRREVTAEDTER